MWWQTLLTVFTNNKKLVTGVLVFALSLYGGNYIKDLIHAGVLAKQDQKILQLVNEISTLRGQKEAQEQQTASALNNFAKEKEKVAIVQKKVDQLIADRDNAPVVIAHTFATVDDCVTELTRVENKYKANEDIYITEIKQDRVVIASCEQVVAAQKVELKTANTIITKDAEVIGSLTLRVATADQDLAKETDKKKFWRTATVTEAAVIIGLILLL